MDKRPEMGGNRWLEGVEGKVVPYVGRKKGGSKLGMAQIGMEPWLTTSDVRLMMTMENTRIAVIKR